MVKNLLCGLAALALVTTPVMAQTIDFGTDSGEWANDGECDDLRFTGAGMTTTELLSEDIMADASDCLAAFEAGMLELHGVSFEGDDIVIDFGDDNGEWANDGECDDPRFTGPGMTATQLLSEDIMHDASDCEAAFDAGAISLLGVE